MRTPRVLVLVLMLIALEPCGARRHRYGHNARKQPTRSATFAVSDHAALRRETAEEARREEEEKRLGDLDDEVLQAATRKATREWPPRWAQPVVVAGCLGYSVIFLNA